MGAALLAAILVFPTTVAAVRVELSTVEGKTVAGAVAGATAEGLILDVDGGEQRISFDDLMLVSISRTGTEAVPEESLRLIRLADGGRLFGRLVGSTDRGLRLDVPTLRGERLFDYTALAGVRLADERDAQAEAAFNRALAQRDPGHDVVIVLRDGQVNTFKGSIESLTPQGGRFNFGGKEMPLRPEGLYAVVLASGAVPAARGPHTLHLVTGETLTGRLTKADAEMLTFAPAATEPVSLPWTQVRQIEVRSKRVAFLSDLEPTAFQHTPYLNVPWPLRRDRSASNGPIRLGRIGYAKGLGMHSHSEVSFALQPGCKQFAAIIGIDDAVRPRGSVVFRVRADGKEVFASGPVSGRDQPRPVLVDIAGATTLTLVVEFGPDADLSDHANWALARVVR